MQALQDKSFDHIEVDYDKVVSTPRARFPAFVAPRGKGSDSNTVVYLDNINPDREKTKTKCTIKEIRAIEEANVKQTLLTEDSIIKRAIYETEEFGVVFIDEIDKIVNVGGRWNADASDEGVQRDLLPLIEGTRIQTDHGEVDTSKILFIASGAFMQVKPSDLLAELQGRLPIRVKLSDLSEDDLYRILVEPEFNLILQQRVLLRTEGVDLRFTNDAIRELARCASEANRTVENIGARRLQTVMETVLEDVSYYASNYSGTIVVLDKEDVEQHMQKLQGQLNLKHYIL
jgi:ATP-dependent HslUV protease ATP-binding subunit HslU